ncbi:MAG: hypothetical protein Q9180_001816 [Flavoplaca navasiana]
MREHLSVVYDLVLLGFQLLVLLKQLFDLLPALADRAAESLIMFLLTDLCNTMPFFRIVSALSKYRPRDLNRYLPGVFPTSVIALRRQQILYRICVRSFASAMFNVLIGESAMRKISRMSAILGHDFRRSRVVPGGSPVIGLLTSEGALAYLTKPSSAGDRDVLIEHAGLDSPRKAGKIQLRLTHDTETIRQIRAPGPTSLRTPEVYSGTKTLPDPNLIKESKHTVAIPKLVEVPIPFPNVAGLFPLSRSRLSRTVPNIASLGQGVASKSRENSSSPPKKFIVGVRKDAGDSLDKIKPVQTLPNSLFVEALPLKTDGEGTHKSHHQGPETPSTGTVDYSFDWTLIDQEYEKLLAHTKPDWVMPLLRKLLAACRARSGAQNGKKPSGSQEECISSDTNASKGITLTTSRDASSHADMRTDIASPFSGDVSLVGKCASESPEPGIATGPCTSPLATDLSSSPHPSKMIDCTNSVDAPATESKKVNTLAEGVPTSPPGGIEFSREYVRCIVSRDLPCGFHYPGLTLVNKPTALPSIIDLDLKSDEGEPETESFGLRSYPSRPESDESKSKQDVDISPSVSRGVAELLWQAGAPNPNRPKEEIPYVFRVPEMIKKRQRQQEKMKRQQKTVLPPENATVSCSSNPSGTSTPVSSTKDSAAVISASQQLPATSNPQSNGIPPLTPTTPSSAQAHSPIPIAAGKSSEMTTAGTTSPPPGNGSMEGMKKPKKTVAAFLAATKKIPTARGHHGQKSTNKHVSSCKSKNNWKMTGSNLKYSTSADPPSIDAGQNLVSAPTPDDRPMRSTETHASSCSSPEGQTLSPPAAGLVTTPDREHTYGSVPVQENVVDAKPDTTSTAPLPEQVAPAAEGHMQPEKSANPPHTSDMQTNAVADAQEHFPQREEEVPQPKEGVSQQSSCAVKEATEDNSTSSTANTAVSVLVDARTSLISSPASATGNCSISMPIATSQFAATGLMLSPALSTSTTPNTAVPVHMPAATSLILPPTSSNGNSSISVPIVTSQSPAPPVNGRPAVIFGRPSGFAPYPVRPRKPKPVEIMEYRYDDDSDDDVDADGDTPMSDDDGYDSGYASGENPLDDAPMVDMCDPMDTDEDMDMMEDPIAVDQLYTSPEEDRYNYYLQQQQLENQRQWEQHMQGGPHQQGFQQQYIQPQHLQYEQQRQQQQPFQQVHPFQELQPSHPVQPAQQPHTKHQAMTDFKLDHQAIADFKLEPNHVGPCAGNTGNFPWQAEILTPSGSRASNAAIREAKDRERRNKRADPESDSDGGHGSQPKGKIAQHQQHETLTAAIGGDFNLGGEEGGRGVIVPTTRTTGTAMGKLLLKMKG